MPRGRGKGGNKRKRGKNIQHGEKRDLTYKTEDQEYGQITRLLGNGRVEVNCFDGVKRISSIRGKLKNRVWMNPGDIILVSLRETGDTADVIHKYYPEESAELQELGEIPDNIDINQALSGDEEEAKEDEELDEDGEPVKDDMVNVDDL